AWSPRWLLDAGYEVRDAGGIGLGLDTAATVSGPVEWVPEVRLPKVDDQVADTAPAASSKHARRPAGEVALGALSRRPAHRGGIPDDVRPTALTGGARGARFKNAVVYYGEKGLPAGWSVRPELRLDTIRGLHLRRDVGEHQSDIAVLDDDGGFMAMISSKWT